MNPEGSLREGRNGTPLTPRHGIIAGYLNPLLLNPEGPDATASTFLALQPLDESRDRRVWLQPELAQLSLWKGAAVTTS